VSARAVSETPYSFEELAHSRIIETFIIDELSQHKDLRSRLGFVAEFTERRIAKGAPHLNLSHTRIDIKPRAAEYDPRPSDVPHNIGNRPSRDETAPDRNRKGRIYEALVSHYAVIFSEPCPIEIQPRSRTR
jgi:hypothetical protein